MSQVTLNFNTPMIDFSTGKPIINTTTEELEKYGIIPVVLTNDPVLNQKAQQEYGKALKDNFDNLSKYTLSDILNQLFDSTEIPNNSDFALYADILKNIRIAKERKQDNIEISKEELEKFKKIFAKPPKDPLRNKPVAFVLECLEQSYIDIVTPKN